MIYHNSKKSDNIRHAYKNNIILIMKILACCEFMKISLKILNYIKIMQVKTDHEGGIEFQ